MHASPPWRLPALGLALLALTVPAATAQLLVDFNSTNQDGGPHNQSGYQPYNAGHEISADFVAPRNYSAFGTTVSLTVDFPDTTDRRVQQMIDRGSGNDANWNGQKLDLLTDWLGVDTRTGNGGNGNGGPTRVTISLGSLPAGAYHWVSYHHDTENVFGGFDLEISTDGGTTYTPVVGPEPGGSFLGTDSTSGGSPASAQTYTGSGGQDPVDLPSTVEFDFTAVAGQDVVARFTPIPGSGVHAQIMTINGLEITSTTPPTGPTDLALSGNTVGASAAIGSLVGTFTTTDPTPGDNFTYTLVGGGGSTDNGQFAIDGDRLETDRDLSGFAGGTTLSVRVRTTDGDGDAFEKVFLIEVVNDSDGDGLDDTWELDYFPSLATATGTGNNDADALNNLQEQAAGTDPTDPDTDGDNLSDSEEVNTHGSDPLLPDSDGDGIDDGDEVSAANGHVTDPADSDSDDDGFDDALEIAEGTDPNNGADFPNTLLALRLNEILARNDTDIRDGFNNREDWIEIYNPNTVAVNLDGYYLTDNATLLTKWNFPAISIGAGGYLIVFASNKDTVDPGGNPHTNFQISADGEFLAIVRPDGTTIDDSFAPGYPEQFTNISYGPPSSGGAPVFFEVSTPGAVNDTAQYPGVVKDTNFSIDRGFYDAPFQVAITTDTPTATIRYTTDGSWPSASHGTVYTEPIDIATTTTLRAIAYQAGWLSTNVDTHTYIFVDDVAGQPSDPPGWPATWGSHDGISVIPSDYEMDPRVVDDVLGIAEHTIREALLDLPSVAISMEIDDFISDATGIYANPQNRTERFCSMEYILPDGTPGFQEDCKIEVHGNASRRPARMQKHSLRLTFSSEIGTPKLRYPLFPQSDVEEFNKLVLRACFTDSWALVSWGGSNRYRPNDSMMTRDVWMKDSMRAMGHASGNGDYVHLYVNGLYFGVHDLTERLEDDWYADHIGGAVEDWEVNADILTPGPLWNSMISLLNGDIASNTVYEQAQQVIDIDNYIDYAFLHFYADAEDWPTKNGYAAVNAISGDGRWRFQVWDQEISLDRYSWNRYNSNSGSLVPFQRLRLNEEFRMRFADRVAMHIYNDGALTVENSTARYLALCDELDKAIMAESARWGDVQESTPYGNTPGSSNDPFADFYPPLINNPIYFTREQHWIVERDHVVNAHIPIIHDEGDSRSIVRELRANNLYPSIDPPVFAQHGGVVPTGYTVGVEAPVGAIYYTTDGSDPRLVGGGINPDAGMLAGGSVLDTFVDFDSTWNYLDDGSDLGASDAPVTATNWRHPDFDDSAWQTGQAMLGYGGITGGTLNTTVSFGPNASDKHITTYLRKEVSVSGASDYTELQIGIKRDDGAVVYLNGVEIARTNMPGGTITSETTASSSVGSSAESAVNPYTYSLMPGDLVEGVNVIAVEAHQSGAGSSDLAIDVEVKAIKPNPGASGVTLTETGTLNARARNGNEWSALTSAGFIVGTPASAANTVVAEIMYNPIGVSEDTEWIELMNISSGAIDLTDVSFTGIDYVFPAGVTLDAGERIVVVKNQVAFAATYDTGGMNIAPGEFAASLSNGGEEIAVLASDGTTDIRRFTYSDSPPWPTAPDGDGYSLVLIAPESDPDHNIAANWRSSANLAGSPGASDAVGFSGDPGADDDDDGMTAFLEHALGSLAGDGGFSPESIPQVGTALIDGDDYLTITFRRNLAADDAVVDVQVADDLAGWTNLGTVFVSSIPNGDGTESVTFRSVKPIQGTSREFIRLSASSRP